MMQFRIAGLRGSGVPVERPDTWSAGELVRLMLVPALTVLAFVGGVYWLRSEHATTPGGSAAPLVQVHLVTHDDAPLVPSAPRTTSNDGNPRDNAAAGRDPARAEEPDPQTVPSVSPALANAPAVPDRGLLNSPSRFAIDGFQQLLLSHIARYQRYPGGAQAQRLSGNVHVQFVLTRDGRLDGAWVRSSSGYAVLDREAIATILRAQPLPKIPSELPERLSVSLQLAFGPG
jgi:periplasmic protein TonB